MSKQTILKKLSIKTAVADSNFKKLTEVTPVLRIVGLGRNFSVGEHPQYGPFYKFMGEFVATDLRTGEVGVASVAYLPSPVDEMLKTAIEAGEGKSVEFAFDISVKPREDLAIGYEYLVATLIESKPTNPLAALLDSLPAPSVKQQALPLDGEAEVPGSAGEAKAKAKGKS